MPSAQRDDLHDRAKRCAPQARDPETPRPAPPAQQRERAQHEPR